MEFPERWYRLIVELLQEGIWLIDADGTTLYVNDEAARMIGYDREELIGKSAFPLVAPESRPAVQERMGMRRRGEERADRFEVGLRHKDGTLRTLSLSAAPLIEEGTYLGSLAAIVDVTDELRIKAELGESEARFRRLTEDAPDIIFRYRLGPPPAFEYVSRALEPITGYTPEQFYADPRVASDALRPEDRELVLARLADPRPMPPTRCRAVRADGEEIWVEIRFQLLTDDDGKPVAAEGIMRDVTESVLAEQELQRSEARFRAVFEASRVAMLLFDDERRFVDTNEAACRMLGLTREEVLGRRIDELVSAGPDVVERGWREFREAGFAEALVRFRRSDGAVRDAEYSATANLLTGRHLAVLYDVTERRRLEAQLQHAQRMEAVGQLAGGVAHDFNNQLGAIRLTAELGLRHLGRDDAKVRAELEQIIATTQSGAALTRQLLLFGRRERLAPRVVDANDVVRSAEAMLHRLIGEHIDVVCELEDGPLYSNVDPTQLEQAIVNLAVNARDAMPGGGRLRLVTRTARPELPGLEPGAYVAIAVSDDGEGIDETVREHLFEPFFTTKPVGEGTGLGLASVYGLARSSGGTVEVESELGVGSTFTLLLPAVAGPAEAVVEAAPDELAPGSGTVLLVEDDEAVRTMIETVLAEAGYRVVAAPDAAAALELFASLRDELDLLLTDVRMPGRDGVELAERLRAARPGLRVVFMSGYAATTSGLPAVEEMLQKPFGGAELTAAVRRALAPA